MNDQDIEVTFEDDLPAQGSGEWAVLSRVIGTIDNRPPWSVDELIRDLGDVNNVTDAINTLYGAGLINRAENLIFPTRAAIVFDQISE